MNDSMFQKLTEDVRLQVKRLEKLDIYTNKHVHNVPKITLKICQKLNVSEEKTRFYINCAYLHDIGKIFIPYEILQKPEKLTDEEYEVMKKHTNAAKYHHENEDGTGYPECLKKDEIPIEAKIVKVADLYDAICSRRQYKPEVKRVDAMNIIYENVQKGKVNKKIFNALVDVAIDEIQEENGDIEEIKKLQEMKR